MKLETEKNLLPRGTGLLQNASVVGWSDILVTGGDIFVYLFEIPNALTAPVRRNVWHLSSDVLWSELHSCWKVIATVSGRLGHSFV